MTVVSFSFMDAWLFVRYRGQGDICLDLQAICNFVGWRLALLIGQLESSDKHMYCSQEGLLVYFSLVVPYHSLIIYPPN